MNCFRFLKDHSGCQMESRLQGVGHELKQGDQLEGCCSSSGGGDVGFNQDNQSGDEKMQIYAWIDGQMDDSMTGHAQFDPCP